MLARWQVRSAHCAHPQSSKALWLNIYTVVQSGWLAHKVEGQRMRLSAMPVHLARLSTAGSGQITAAAVSPDGSLVAIADSEEVHMYAMADAGEGWT